MHKFAAGLLGILLIAATAPSSPRPLTIRDDFQQLRDVVIHGVVYATSDDKRGPVHGASVELEATNGSHSIIASVVTDSAGRFAITNPSRTTDANYLDVKPGTYRLWGSYRSNRTSPGLVVLSTGATVSHDIDVGTIAKGGGGGAPPAAAIAFYVTDRQADLQATSIDAMFKNGRLVDSCTNGVTCMMSYGEAAPIGNSPVLNADATTSVADLITKMRNLPQFANATSVLVFIHGYNNDFIDPMKIGATWLAAYDKSEPVIVYSWPSNHKTPKYLDDEVNNTWSQDHFRDFMLALMSDPKTPKTVNIFAHSMGNRLALGFLDYLASAKPPLQAQIGQAIFAAPDVDSATFFEAIPRISTIAAGLTMYGSSHDNALQLSRGLHGHCRAGLVGCDYAIPDVPNFNAIDASMFHCDVLGHGYWLSSDTLQADIVTVLKSGTMKGPARANLISTGVPSGYAFDSAVPSDTTCAAEAKN